MIKRKGTRWNRILVRLINIEWITRRKYSKTTLEREWPKKNRKINDNIEEDEKA